MATMIRSGMYAALVVMLLTVAVQAQQAFEFRGDSIYIDRASQWSRWIMQNNLVSERSVRVDSTHLYDITYAGIKPKFFSKIKNYSIDIDAFEYLDNVRLNGEIVQGNVVALSNPFLAERVVDGDPTTFWEPAAADFDDDGLRNWQIEVDLGRTVWADSVVIVTPPMEEAEAVVPIIPEGISIVNELPRDLQTVVYSFARQVALDSIVVATPMLNEEGDTLAHAGDVIVGSGQQLPRDLGQIRLLNRLGISSVPVQGAEDPGDVPKLFAVEVSMGKQSGSVSSKNYAFDLIGRASGGGRERRFVFPLMPLDKADFDLDGEPDVPGSFIHFVRVTVFESDFDQKEFLGEGEEGRLAYEALEPERQGQLVYRRVTSGGYIKRIKPLLDESGQVVESAAQIYDSLPDDERGLIQYFKRERPLISEIQVWGHGPNVAYRPERRAGGSYEDGGLGSPELSTDGVYLSRWLGNSWDRKYSTGSGGEDALVCCTMWLDLGAAFWIDTIFMGSITTSENSSEGSLFGLHMLGSDGTALKPLNMKNVDDFWQLEFGLAWTDLASEIHKDNNDAQARLTREKFSQRKLRFFEFRNLDPTGASSGNYSAQGHFNEIQMYGEGYPAEISFVSPPIVLMPGVSESDAAQVKARRVLSQIFWDVEAVVQVEDSFTGQQVEVVEPLDIHPEVQVQLQTRTSQTIDSLFSYYVVTGAGTKSEKRTEIPIDEYVELQDLWNVYFAWEALPESRTVRLRDHQTGRDDDGDGTSDEDPIDGIDNDGDNLIDEDGLSGEEGGPNFRGRITLTKHQRKQDDDGDGANDEDPIDGLDNDGDFLIDEDGKKAPKPRQEPDMGISPIFAGWSPWSQPYSPTGGEKRAQITSPSPRKFMQVRVNIVSNDPLVSARLKSLRIDLAPPISTEMVGELAVLTTDGILRSVRDLGPAVDDYGPPREVEPLVHQPFSYFLRAAGPDPNVAEVVDGFDQLLLVTPTSAELIGLRAGRVSVALDTSEVDGAVTTRAVETRFDRSFSKGEDEMFTDENGLALSLETIGDSLIVTFPNSINKGFTEIENAVVELQFRAQTLRAGTQFQLFVRDTGSDDPLFQRVEAEGRDATELANSQTVRPVVVHSSALVSGLDVARVFTPNGDGFNDELDINFTILNLREDRPLSVVFHDLAGRVVALARSRSGSSEAQGGKMHYTWDGRDGNGNTVPPGIYMCRVELEADSNNFTTLKLVNVVY